MEQGRPAYAFKVTDRFIEFATVGRSGDTVDGEQLGGWSRRPGKTGGGYAANR
jgi:hypothetical protein